MQRRIIVLFLDRGALLQMEICITFTKGNLCPVFRQKVGGQEVLLVSAVSQWPSSRNNHIPKLYIWGWYKAGHRLFITGASCVGVGAMQSHRALHSEDPVLGSMLCCHQIEILNF